MSIIPRLQEILDKLGDARAMLPDDSSSTGDFDVSRAAKRALAVSRLRNRCADHGLAAVRDRALERLASKLQNKLVTVHDVVHEVSRLDKMLQHFLEPAASDATSSPSLPVVTALFSVLLHLAKHPFGHAWLLDRRGVALVGAARDRVAAVVCTDADTAARDAAVAAAGDVLTALLSQPVVEDVSASAALTALTAASAASAAAAAASAASHGAGGAHDGVAADAGAVQAAELSAMDALLLQLAEANTHDEFLRQLVALQALCTANVDVAVRIAVSGRWQDPLQRFLEVPVRAIALVLCACCVL
jgi:hypothetical protein